MLCLVYCRPKPSVDTWICNNSYLTQHFASEAYLRESYEVGTVWRGASRLAAIARSFPDGFCFMAAS
jgi:hypothetical protein